jgi:hypothetical protein
LLFEAKLNNNVAPSVPEDLDWFQYETSWQTVAEARMKFNAENVSLQVEYSTDLGIDASLVAGAQTQNIKLGGTFEQFEKTRWTVFGQFG